MFSCPQKPAGHKKLQPGPACGCMRVVFPVNPPSPPSAPLPVVCAIIEREGRVLLARRPCSKHLGGLWEFPGGKIESGETSALALQREIQEELGASLHLTHDLGVFVHAYDSTTIALHAWVAQLVDPATALMPTAHDDLAWVKPSELTHFPLAPADVPIVAAYQATLPPPPSRAPPTEQ